jgi:hypothetical protein
VVKTSLKLLIVFAEYTETNSLLILSAVTQVDRAAKHLLWSNAMKILNEMDNSSSEVVLLIITLFNTVLSAIPDQDSFYDMTDSLEKQGMQKCTQFFLNRKPAEPDLAEQFNIYDVSSIYPQISSSAWFSRFRRLYDTKTAKMTPQLLNPSGT